MGNDSRKHSWGPRPGRPGGADNRARKTTSFKVQAKEKEKAAAAPARKQQLLSSYNLAWEDLHAYLRGIWPDVEFDEHCRNDKFVLDLPEPLNEEQLAKISELRKPPPDEGAESE